MQPIATLSESCSIPRQARRLEPRVICIPEQSWQDLLIALGLFLLSFAYLCLFRRLTSFEPDEGIILQGAQRILDGQVPYRDFFSFYTPGSYYFLALLFKIFGNSFLVARTALAFFGAIFSFLFYLLARRVCCRSNALLTAALLTLSTLPFRYLVLHNWDSTLLACFAVYCAVRMVEAPDWRWPLFLGSFTSLTCLFEQSKGAGLLLGLLLGATGLQLGQIRPAIRKSHILWGALGFALPLLVTVSYFGRQHALGAMLSDWLWPVGHYSSANHLPYGYLNWSDRTRQMLLETGSWDVRLLKLLAIAPLLLVPILPISAAALFLYWIVQSRRTPVSSTVARYYIVLTAALTGLWLSSLLVRPDIVHLMYLQPLFALVLAWTFEGRDLPGVTLEKFNLPLKVAATAAFIAFSMGPLSTALSTRHEVASRRGLVTVFQKDTVAAYVQTHLAEGQQLLIYPYLPLYYYLTATRSPNRFEYFQPGMNTPEQAQEIVASLARAQTSYVLFEPAFNQKVANSWPHTPASALVSDPVSDFVLHHYRTCRILHSPSDWDFHFMARRDLPCPQD